MAERSKSDSQILPVISSNEVRHWVGPVADETILAILKCGASIEELEVAASYLRGEGNELDRTGHPLTGKIAQLYDILSADEFYANGDQASPTGH